MMHHITVGTRAYVALETAACIHGLTINNGEEPVFGECDVPIPSGVRLATMDHCGRMARDWQWSETIDWPEVFAWSPLPHDNQLEFCEHCQFPANKWDRFLDGEGICPTCRALSEEALQCDASTGEAEAVT